MHCSKRWRPVGASTADRGSRFHLNRALECLNFKLIKQDSMTYHQGTLSEKMNKQHGKARYVVFDPIQIQIQINQSAEMSVEEGNQYIPPTS